MDWCLENVSCSTGDMELSLASLLTIKVRFKVCDAAQTINYLRIDQNLLVL